MPSEFAPRRVACLQPSATVILAALDLLDRVIACTRYCADVVPQVRDGFRLIVADSWAAKADEILQATPDLVIAAVPYQEKAVAEILKAGSRFLGLAPRSLTDIYGDIAAIAGIMDASKRGESVIAEMQAEINTVQAATARLHHPRVYCEEWGKPLIRSQSWVAELVAAAGGQFLGAPGEHTSAENVLAENPEVIIAAWCGAGDRVPLEKIVRERGWAETQAAKQGRVYCIRDELLNTPAPTLLQGLQALAGALHPQKFPHPFGLRCLAAFHPETADSSHL